MFKGFHLVSEIRGVRLKFYVDAHVGYWVENMVSPS
jgi:hypothetical protein